MSRDRRGSRYAREESREWFALLRKMGPENEQALWDMVRRLTRADVRRELSKVGDRLARIDAAGRSGEEVLAEVLLVIRNGKVRPSVSVNGR